ncbi:T9SS type A sorting domain-containing protein [Taibaiella lutea]|uniref:T9SS type A sorting domain-containing protein n=1 Tax=Taibaiella lutea TaxID=2608001 RepID=A0A5M6CLU0_9BACT|nr:T9SS type A sorting domain-containing protein [Taibaiella lutea]KAA5536094.1 T9SS type A sorting domain-containing protein [Taibaiella lutea]
MYRFLSSTILLFAMLSAKAQYAPQTPLQGNTAIPQNDSRIVDWAATCSIERGWLDIADTSLGHPTLGSESDAVGIPGSGVVSLGDSGVAVLTFNYHIYNGSGADFAVFENGFSNPENDSFAYLELAFVEVSSDGIHYFRFPASSAMQDTVQIDNFTYSLASKYHNLAGKYVSGYGTPFDLEDLKNIQGLDINNISHVRLVDVIGSINPLYASMDKDNHIINEAYPSPYPSAGFDLNGVGVINSLKPTSVKELNNSVSIKIYPNPTNDIVYIISENGNKVHYSLKDITGKEICNGSFSGQTFLSLKERNKGFYFLYLEYGNEHFVQKIIKY